MVNQKRRKFIVNSLKVVVGIMGMSVFGKSLAFSNHKEMSNLISDPIPIRNNKKNNRVLVAYESKFGSTSEVAHFIGKEIAKNGLTVDVRKIIDIDDLENYKQVVIGSAIQYDNWMPEARQFVEKNKNMLFNQSVSLFFSCLVLSKKSESANQKAIGYANKLNLLLPQVKTENIGRFAGVLSYSKMSFGTRLFAKGLFSIIGVKEGDYRNWDSIRLWTNSIIKIEEIHSVSIK